MAPKLLVIGLDCAEPSLVFDRWRDDLPHLSQILAAGSYGRLESSIPAITVPAWSCMTSGRDPGELGIYGFRNRVDRSYGRLAIADSRAVKVPRLWDLLGDAGWTTCTISVPGTFPPAQIDGSMVSCFLTPSADVTFTYPPELGDRLLSRFGDWILDVDDFRSNDKARILRDLYLLCDRRFDLAESLIAEEDPDFLMLVDMGVDRIHHAFWRYMDPRHPAHEPGNPWQNGIRDYYRHADGRIGRLLAACDEQTAVLVVSDHGAQPLMGGVCINEWLQREGFLTLKTQPDPPGPLRPDWVDWSRTRAWGAGGHYGRVFLNVAGREPEGIVAPADFEAVRADLIAGFEAMTGPDGQPLGNRAYTPRELYRRVRGIPPDLLVYFGNLAWRSLGTVGRGELFAAENDTGPDDANHAQQGLMAFYDPQAPKGGAIVEGATLYDIVPTLLTRYGLPLPPDLRGKVLEV